MLMFEGVLTEAEANKASSMEAKEEGHAALPIRSCRHEAVAWTSHSVRDIRVAWELIVVRMRCVANRFTKGACGHESPRKPIQTSTSSSSPTLRSSAAAVIYPYSDIIWSMWLRYLSPVLPPCMHSREVAISFLTWSSLPLPRCQQRVGGPPQARCFNNTHSLPD